MKNIFFIALTFFAISTSAFALTASEVQSLRQQIAIVEADLDDLEYYISLIPFSVPLLTKLDRIQLTIFNVENILMKEGAPKAPSPVPAPKETLFVCTAEETFDHGLYIAKAKSLVEARAMALNSCRAKFGNRCPDDKVQCQAE